ncbi:MAG: UbiD family decarboxylase [Desulfitobacteriaceae bacterium]|nr:UbiD family decarboxylase [Desulfitobacteriaceae bacterium]
MYSNLRSFINALKREKLLIEIETEVDPHLELAEIHRRVIESEGPALFFKNVKGSQFPVVTNLFGTRERVNLAIGPKPEKIIRSAAKDFEHFLPPEAKICWQNKALLLALAKSGLKNVSPRKAPVLEVAEKNLNLGDLPVLTSWPKDGGPFITLPLVYTEHPVTLQHNLGMYRIQIHDKQKTGIHWQIHKGGGFHHYAAEQLNIDLPVTCFLGGPPALILAAIAPLPEMLSELLFASFLMNEKLSRVKVPGYPHPLIAEAEFAISGSVPVSIRQPEGPFGDHYGYYSLTHNFPIFNVQALFHRKDAIYPATVVGKPRQEDYFIGEYLQDMLAPVFPIIMPGVKAIWTYAETGFHSLAAAIVRESYSREALTHAFRILGEGQLTLTKFLIITDVNINLKNFPTLLEHILSRFDPEHDLLIITNTSMDTLDYSGGHLNHGSKVIMLGLGNPKRKLPVQYKGFLPPGIKHIQAFCAGCLLIAGPSFAVNPNFASDLLQLIKTDSAFNEWPLIILSDTWDKPDQTSFLWRVFTRFDPASDMFCAVKLEKNHCLYQGPIIIDARSKPGYPEKLIPDEETVDLVNKRWPEYKITIT